MGIVRDLEAINSKLSDLRSDIETLGSDNDIDVSDMVDYADSIWNDIDDLVGEVRVLKDDLSDIRNDIERSNTDLDGRIDDLD